MFIIHDQLCRAARAENIQYLRQRAAVATALLPSVLAVKPLIVCFKSASNNQPVYVKINLRVSSLEPVLLYAVILGCGRWGGLIAVLLLA